MKNNDQWLRDQCEHYVHGQCNINRCLKRGGYVNGKPETAKPTCEAHEILLELEDLRLFYTCMQKS